MSSARGLSMVEVLIVIALVVMVLSAVYLLWSSSLAGTRMGVEVLSLSHELARLAQQVRADTDRSLKVRWGSTPITVAGADRSLPSLLKNLPVDEATLLEVPGGRITYRLTRAPKGKTWVERCQETGAVGGSGAREVRRFAVDMAQSFALVPLMIHQGPVQGSRPAETRHVLMHIVLAPRKGSGARRTLVLTTVLTPRAIAQTTWNTFQ